jgi:phosphomannomutase
MREKGYRSYVGEISSILPRHAFYVPTGLKNLVRVGQMDRTYEILTPRPDHWMDRVLLAGEESSGLTTRGHIPDKDGLLANLLTLDLIARYRTSLQEVWNDLTTRYWRPCFDQIFLPTTGSDPSALIDMYLQTYDGAKPGSQEFARRRILYLGGVPGRFAEFRLEDAAGSVNNFVQIRPSGTEPLVRIYLEASSRDTLKALREKIQIDAGVT